MWGAGLAASPAAASGGAAPAPAACQSPFSRKRRAGFGGADENCAGDLDGALAGYGAETRPWKRPCFGVVAEPSPQSPQPQQQQQPLFTVGTAPHMMMARKRKAADELVQEHVAHLRFPAAAAAAPVSPVYGGVAAPAHPPSSTTHVLVPPPKRACHGGRGGVTLPGGEYSPASSSDEEDCERYLVVDRHHPAAAGGGPGAMAPPPHLALAVRSARAQHCAYSDAAAAAYNLVAPHQLTLYRPPEEYIADILRRQRAAMVDTVGGGYGIDGGDDMEATHARRALLPAQGADNMYYAAAEAANGGEDGSAAASFLAELPDDDAVQAFLEQGPAAAEWAMDTGL